MRASRLCEVCGEAFEPHDAARSRFCSRRCSGRSRRKRVEFVCPVCGVKGWAHESRRAVGKGVYCSRAHAGVGRRINPDQCLTAQELDQRRKLVSPAAYWAQVAKGQRKAQNLRDLGVLTLKMWGITYEDYVSSAEQWHELLARPDPSPPSAPRTS